MIRRSSGKPVVTLALFPFLAVLVCTMGALIVLLVSVVQKVHVDTTAEATAQNAELAQAETEKVAQLKLDIDDQQWRRSELERQRTDLQSQSAQRRLTLSHYEDHIRRLQQQFKQLQNQAHELQRLGSQQSYSTEESRARLAQLQGELVRRDAELAAARQQAAGRERTFAIIPYAGPNGTKRRPIYIECTDQGITLQPEGIVLTPADFEGSLGPGNPLDAALRTIRECYAKFGVTKEREEPYPLLIVRPSGTVAYAVARAALKSWDDEFGYELVDADMKLAYPKPDQRLKVDLERSIADARQRQSVLASIMPGRFQGSGFSGLVATTNGGFTAMGGEGAPPRGSTSPSNSGVPAHNASFSNIFGEDVGGDIDGGLTMQSAQRPSTKSKGGTSSNKAAPSTSPPHSVVGTTGGNGTPTGAPTANQAGGQPVALPGMPKGTSSAATNSQQLGAAKAGESGTGAQRGMPPGRKAPLGMHPIAQERGSDWGLPNRGSVSTGIQRSIQVQCLADRLVLLPERGDYRQPVVVPMPSDTAAAMDPFVTAVWNRMEQWGIAGDNCYWKPVLRVQVSPNAESRFADFSTLLDGSGFAIERKK